MRALVIREPWINLILEGRKTWEIRGSNCNIRERIGLVRSGSRLVVGTVEIVNARGPLTFDEFSANVAKHCMPPSAFYSLPYRDKYAWILADPKALAEPFPYEHPRGARIWVEIPDI